MTIICILFLILNIFLFCFLIVILTLNDDKHEYVIRIGKLISITIKLPNRK